MYLLTPHSGNRMRRTQALISRRRSCRHDGHVLAGVEVRSCKQETAHRELEDRPEPVEDARASLDRNPHHPAAEDTEPEESDQDELATMCTGRGREPERE